ncbi:hypothetical protein [Nocardioides alcanivorans]|uniref:hypothetical protein n=1 Tax=Nocardioides alcanivorans TaxID=2897352 RepID=UPI001F32F497|nr:hypothetical protein [Nocardioides alcanivorans]
MDLHWLPEELHPVALRIARADEQALAFGELALHWSRGDGGAGPLTIRQVERREGLLDFEVHAVRPVPPATSMLFSEAINHLRAAIDNALYALIQKQHGAPLTTLQARAIAFPIRDDEDALVGDLQKMTKKGISCVGPDTQLGKRISALQPFNDTESKIPAISPALAMLTGATDLGHAHPLKLLQAYSNEDKHRGIRLSAAGVMAQEESAPLAASQMKPVQAGVVLTQVLKGVPALWSTSAAILLQRPDGRWIPPGPELDQLTAYVAEVVLPTLVTGFTMPGTPVHIDLGDNNLSDAERVAAALPERAMARAQAMFRKAYFEAIQRSPEFPPIISSDELDSSGAE